jgi:hypothetical protein
LLKDAALRFPPVPEWGMMKCQHESHQLREQSNSGR